MGVFNSPNKSQEEISELFGIFNMLHAHMYNVKVITKSNFLDHMKYLDKFSQKLAVSRLKVHT